MRKVCLNMQRSGDRTCCRWPPHKSVEESRAVIKNVFDGAECYAICEKENNIAIGAVELKLNGYTNKTKRDDECELGYWLGQPFWGRGYMPGSFQRVIETWI